MHIQVSKKQEDAIRKLFGKRKWELVEVDATGAVDGNKKCNDDVLEEQNPGPALQSHCEGHLECPHCFCAPCITDLRHRQMWWPVHNAAPSRVNRGARKKLYYKFWSLLANKGLWRHEPRYTQRKRQAMQLDGRMRDLEWHRRELMPDCVIKTVRTWLPKTDGEVYTGHRWENYSNQ